MFGPWSHRKWVSQWVFGCHEYNETNGFSIWDYFFWVISSSTSLLKAIQVHQKNFNKGHKKPIEQWNWVLLPPIIFLVKGKMAMISTTLFETIFKISVYNAKIALHASARNHSCKNHQYRGRSVYEVTKERRPWWLYDFMIPMKLKVFPYDPRTSIYGEFQLTS